MKTSLLGVKLRSFEPPFLQTYDALAVIIEFFFDSLQPVDDIDQTIFDRACNDRIDAAKQSSVSGDQSGYCLPVHIQ